MEVQGRAGWSTGGPANRVEETVMTIKRTYYIDAPIEAVFEVLTAVKEIEPEMMHVYDVKETKDGVGTTFSWDFKIAGRKIFSGFEVYTDVVPNKRLVERSAGFLSATWVTTFAVQGKGTNVTMEVSPEGLWRFPPLVQLFEVVFSRRGLTMMPVFEKKAQALARRKARKAAPRPKTAAAH